MLSTKKTLLCSLILSIYMPVATISAVDFDALNHDEVEQRIDEVQDSVLQPSWLASNLSPKWFVGTIISNIFDGEGFIKNMFIAAFSGIDGNYNNSIMKWDGAVFFPSNISDSWSEVQINANLSISGSVISPLRLNDEIQTTNDIIISRNGNSLFQMNQWGVNSLAVWNMAGVNNSIWSYQTAIWSFAGNNNIWLNQTAVWVFAWQNNTQRDQVAIWYRSGYNNTGVYQTSLWSYAWVNNNGAYNISLWYRAWYWNLGNNVIAIGNQAAYNNTLDNQFIIKQGSVNSQPLIQWNFQTGNVWIGLVDPAATLHVAGNIIANDPTADNHVATKAYVDSNALSPLWVASWLWVGQQWYDMRWIRNRWTIYQNVTSNPIMVNIRTRAARWAYVSTDSVNWVHIWTVSWTSHWNATVSFIVPQNHYYRFDGRVEWWAELR